MFGGYFSGGVLFFGFEDLILALHLVCPKTAAPAPIMD